MTKTNKKTKKPQNNNKQHKNTQKQRQNKTQATNTPMTEVINSIQHNHKTTP